MATPLLRRVLTAPARTAVAVRQYSISSASKPPSSSPARPTSALPIKLSPAQPTRDSLALHSFFAAHRPLLSLDSPSPSPSAAIASVLGVAHPKEPATPAEKYVAERQPFQAPGEPATQLKEDETAAAARLLGWAITKSRVGAESEWRDVQARLGESVAFDSVRRKRRKKITKHKYKKRRKVQRAERRKLGK